MLSALKLILAMQLVYCLVPHLAPCIPYVSMPCTDQKAVAASLLFAVCAKFQVQSVIQPSLQDLPSLANPVLPSVMSPPAPTPLADC